MDRIEEIREKYQHELVIDDAPHYWIEFDKDDLVWLLSTIDTLQEQLAEEHAISNSFKDRMLIAEATLAEKESENAGLIDMVNTQNKQIAELKAELHQQFEESISIIHDQGAKLINAEARCTTCDKHDSYFEGEWKQRAEKAEARLKPIEEINQRFDINAVIKVTEYKYFGDYEFSEPQRVAVAKLVEMAEAIKKCCEGVVK